ncbi:MAG: hypothetical protein PHX43_07175 [Alphaproteobacteria bacterium]|nr:hypothetical protein [Alphaproteobacteria bacterium]
MDLNEIERILSPLATGMPAGAFWLSLFVLVILAITAIIDAFTAKVPDNFILFGFAVVIVTQGVCVDWPFAANRLAMGIATAVGLYGLNQLWYKFFHYDGFGMGDAKWTALAVSTFHFVPVAIAWILGAWLGILWLGLLYLLYSVRNVLRIKKLRKPTHVHFAPFLLIGLIIGLYMRAMT